MKRRYDLYLTDILEAIEAVEGYVAPLTQPELAASREKIAACVRELETIGEAVAQLPDELKRRHPGVPWQRIKDFRNVVVHQYWKVDVNVLWTTIKGKLPPLQRQIEHVLELERKREAA